MGITPWLMRHADPATAADEAEIIDCSDAPAIESDTVDLDSLGWTALQDTARECRRCPLHEGRSQVVFGVGDPQADWLFVGEAPGAEEDLRGEPFVGRAGKLLDEMLRAVGMAREQVYIANVLKCRPPDNRDPQPAESDTCAPFLTRQIDLIRPKVIIAVGKFAAHRLLETDAPVGRMRGKIHHYGAGRVPVVVTYHPAYLLRRPGEKAKSWQDLLLALRVAREAE